MAMARIFRSGNSQAVRLPKHRLDAEEAGISRQGKSLVLTPIRGDFGGRLVEVLEELSDLIEVPPDERRGELIGANDLWIAARARSAGRTLVTNNEREFRRAPELSVENWASA